MAPCVGAAAFVAKCNVGRITSAVKLCFCDEPMFLYELPATPVLNKFLHLKMN